MLNSMKTDVPEKDKNSAANAAEVMGRTAQPPMIRLLLPKLFDQGSQPIQFRGGAHSSDDCPHCGGKFLWHSSIPRHGVELYHQRMWTARKRL